MSAAITGVRVRDPKPRETVIEAVVDRYVDMIDTLDFPDYWEAQKRFNADLFAVAAGEIRKACQLFRKELAEAERRALTLYSLKGD